MTEDENEDLRSHIGFEHGTFALVRKPEPQDITAWCKKKRGDYVSNYGKKTIISNETVLEVIGSIYENPELLSS